MPKPDVSDQRKPQILAAATELFSEKGIHASSMNEIARAAGVSKATIYYYYDNKEALIGALMNELFKNDEPALEELSQSEASALDSLRAYTFNLIDLLEAHESQLPIYAEFKALSARDLSVRNVLEPCFLDYVRVFSKVIERGIEEQAIRADLDVESAAWRLSALIEGCMTLRHTTSRSFRELMEPCFAQFFQTLEA